MQTSLPDFSEIEGTLPRVEGILTLTGEEAYRFLQEGAILVDLREAYETNFRIFDVPEALYLPWTRFPSQYQALPKDRPLILADAAGIYAREAARILKNAGYANIASLAAGMIDWHAEGFPILKNREFELNGQCACKLKTSSGGNPLIEVQKKEKSTPH
ncbi:MAG: rhodanese-like domain-containing protein [Rectinema sp.]|nr:rhodanese-like domain-containing protein [Rectinema sp.]